MERYGDIPVESDKTTVSLWIPPKELFLVLLLSFFSLVSSSSWGSITVPPLNGVADRAVSLWDTAPLKPLSIAYPSVPALIVNTKGFTRDISVDPEKRIITLKETVHGLELKRPLIFELNTFVKVKSLEALPRLLREERRKALTEEQAAGTKRAGINIDIPVKFPKALSRIIGEGGGLKITGYRKINFSGRSEWTEGDVLTATHRPSKFPSLVMEQRSQFKIEGTIGEKIHVYVDQDSERMTELENAIRINYKGSEDEIVQEIQAGNTSLSLPGTQFVSFSQQNKGLFGIKASAKIGPVDLVAIASQDKGAGQRKSFQAGAESSADKIPDYRYDTSRYFFLDAMYVKNYYENYTQDWKHIAANERIDSLEVFIDDNINNDLEGRGKLADAVVNPQSDDTTTFDDIGDDENHHGYFDLLDPDEYFVQKDLGYIRLNSTITGEKTLAVRYKLVNSTTWVGTAPSDTSSDLLLKLIRPGSPRPSHDTWDLSWKNVYSLGRISEDGLDIKIYFDTAGEEDDDSQGGDKYVTIMGLDKYNNANPGTQLPDNLFDAFDRSLVNYELGELHFPQQRPFAPDTALFGIPLNTPVPEIYDESNTTLRQQATKYYIAVESQTRKTSYSLGINIIEGSEVVKLNGRALQRNKDYNIIYEVGQITFLTDEAMDPSADITVDYEYAPFFMPEKKTLLGFRADYSFWEDASWGATFLYRSESTIDRRIRLGQEPSRAIVWDSDIHLNFEPQILTDMVDALPFVRTNAPSALKIDGEVAQSLPNSNTKGDAYVDDFDGSKNTTSLGVMRGHWTLASPPSSDDPVRGQYSIWSRWQSFYWYNPYTQVSVTDIWPEKEVLGRENKTHVLTLEFTPKSDPIYNPNPANSWAGVMRALSQGNYNQSLNKYLEVWVQGSSGQVNIDLGLISEDVIPNGKLDSEDIGADTGVGDGILDKDPDEDVGMDGMADGDPRAVAAGGDFWDIDSIGSKQAWEPYSNDNWNYNNKNIYTQINGTEGNRDDYDRAQRPDTEDINGKSLLETENAFFRYSFSLEEDSPDTVYVAGGDPNVPWRTRWRLYRIPLAQASDTVGAADMEQIRFARIWITGVARPTTISLAAIDIVGNDWLEDGIEPAALVSIDETFSVAVKNTHDNPEPDYIPPPGVEGVKDAVTGLRQMEQSLVLMFENLAPGHSGSASQDYSTQAKDFTQYRTLRMYVHGNLRSSAGVDIGVAEFFFRFGADAKNYYEYHTMIYPGWDPRNEVNIEFDDLTNLKYQKLESGNTEGDTTDGHFTVMGKPSLSAIKKLTAGVKSVSFHPVQKGIGTPRREETISGEVWIDELRLSNARDDPGLASRLTVNATLADLGGVTFNMSRTDAEFQSLGAGSRSDAQKTAKSDESIQGNLNADKFLPEKWGISLPVSGSYSKTTQLPKLQKGSDVNLTSDEQWRQRTENISKSGRISFSKTKPSSFWLLGLTLDRMKVSASGSEKEGRSTTNPYSLTRQLSGSFSYNLQSKKDLSLSPLAWTASKFVPKFISETKITLIPSNISFDTSINQTRTQKVDRHDILTSNFSRKTTQKVNSSMNPFGSVSANYSFNRGFDSQRAQVMRLRFGRETDRTQSLSLTYKPPFLKWLGPNYSYRINYHEKENTKVKPQEIDTTSTSTREFGLDADNSISHSIGASLNVSQFLTSLGAPKKDEKIGLLSYKRVLGTLKYVTDRFQSVSASFQKDRRSNWFSLLGRPTLDYQFGFSSEPGIGSDPNLTGQTHTSSSGQGWSAKSGLNLMAGVNVSTSISSDNKSTVSSTGRSDSRTMTFPQVSTRWGDFGKLYLIRNLVQSSSLDFSYTEKKTEEGTDNFKVLRSESVNKNFSPLFSWSATWAKNLSSTLTSNRTETVNTDHQRDTETVQTNSSLRASFKYSFSAPQGITLPLFGKVKFQSNLNVNLDFKLDNTKNITKNAANPVTKDDQTRSISLGGSYTFSKKVKGGLKVEISDRHDRKTDKKTMVRDVGLWTEIRFD
ncbi:MAG: cell surface protein SprA [Gemmatimonadota bacterium]|nr:MAG: cell surface protein SprA [Gemmatimonadota bacterium]